jgi:lysophospholipase L1-like esterase
MTLQTDRSSARSRTDSFSTAHLLGKGIKATAMGAIAFAAALLLWEGILQLLVESNRGGSTHPALGKIDSPGLRQQTREGFGRFQLNSLGMRAPEPTPKQAGDQRILMLGDSFTRADEVNAGINFSDRLQTAFNSRESAASKSAPVSASVEIINAGKPSASPASYLYAAKFHRQTFDPDSTVIQITESDFTMDMNDPASEFYLEKGASDGYQVRYNETFGSADPLAQAMTEHAPQMRSLLEMSVLRVGGRNLRNLISPPDSSDEAAPSLSPAEQQSIQAEDAATVQWTVRQLKAEFPNAVLLFIPAMGYQDAADISSDPRNAAIESSLETAAAAEGVPLINMRSDFLAHYRSSGTPLRGFNNTLPDEGHLNTAGHHLVAQRLFEFYSQSNSPLLKN